MDDSRPPPGQPPVAPRDVLQRLHGQLHVLVVALVADPRAPATAAMLATVRDTAARWAGLLGAVEPVALCAIRAALDHARAGEFSEASSELLASHRRLGVLLHRDRPRRDEAAHEPTLRWEPPRIS